MISALPVEADAAILIDPCHDMGGERIPYSVLTIYLWVLTGSGPMFWNKSFGQYVSSIRCVGEVYESHGAFL